MALDDELIAQRQAFTPNGTDSVYSTLTKALWTLSTRVYTWAVLLMAFALFGFAAWREALVPLYAALGFTGLVLVPLAWRERRR